MEILVDDTNVHSVIEALNEKGYKSDPREVKSGLYGYFNRVLIFPNNRYFIHYQSFGMKEVIIDEVPTIIRTHRVSGGRAFKSNHHADATQLCLLDDVEGRQVNPSNKRGIASRGTHSASSDNQCEPIK